ncbi:Rid family detoxifying hydrolase [Variovorax sp. E3]|uniref:Rid family detoxifying hydrolase n=1 Tax=Variovorax sp. E3 TaxID=1914993 RepID=UPI0018DBC85E|nr:Rid family detoxifying hydrolase [Variovorax sp. E3]
MTLKKIATTLAPAAVGPYSQAIEHQGLLYVSGQLPLDAQSGQIVGKTAAEQATQCLENLRTIAVAANTSLARTVKTTVLLTDLRAFQAVNEIYASYFSEPFPARACYQVVALPKGAAVEIEAVIAL